MQEKMSKSLGLIVKKQEKWALVYSKKFGIGLLRAIDCISAEDKQVFANNCNPGDWIGVNYIKTAENVRNKFTYMCLPNIEAKEGANFLQTKLVDNIVQ
uniref:Uncharacterized protein n=1 Tax=Ditylenchus dipsaci TaxID=166011 RepID=A0A915DKW8_9BILA